MRAAAFPGDTESSGGLLLDLASELRRGTGVRTQAVGRALAERLRDAEPGGGDRHRRYRAPRPGPCRRLLDLDSEQRLLLVLEDLHWADPLSIEVVAHLAARLRSPYHAGHRRLPQRRAVRRYADARVARRRLLTQRQAEEIRLPRLSLAETTTLTSAMLGRRAPTPWVAAIHERSDGIPLHIEELVSAGNGSTDVEFLRFPETLADAVLVRTVELDQATRDVAAAAAVIGRSFDFDLLVTMTGRDPIEVDPVFAGSPPSIWCKPEWTASGTTSGTR